jgi:hypothetical protein
MKKIALFVALAMIAATPAMAQKKKNAAPAMSPEAQAWDNSYRLVRDGLPMWLPSWAQIIYQTGIKPNAEAAEPAKPAKRRAKKQS